MTLCDIRVVTGFGSRVVLAYGLCADCNLCNRSSVVIDVVPRLPRHPALEGKYLQPYYSPFRFPGRPDRVNVSKVSPSAFSHLTDVSRYHFDAAVLTFGSNDPAGTSQRVYEWLGGLCNRSVFFFLSNLRLDHVSSYHT